MLGHEPFTPPNCSVSICRTCHLVQPCLDGAIIQYVKDNPRRSWHMSVNDIRQLLLAKMKSRLNLAGGQNPESSVNLSEVNLSEVNLSEMIIRTAAD